MSITSDGEKVWVKVGPPKLLTVERVEVWSGPNAFSYLTSALRVHLLSFSSLALVTIQEPETFDS